MNKDYDKALRLYVFYLEIGIHAIIAILIWETLRLGSVVAAMDSVTSVMLDNGFIVMFIAYMLLFSGLVKLGAVSFLKLYEYVTRLISKEFGK